MSTGTLSLLACIRAVCAKASAVNAASTQAIADIEAVRAAALGLEAQLQASGAALECVLTGAVGASCTLPGGAALPSVAEALDRLNAASVASITVETFTASAGQTLVTLSATPASAALLEVALNGALCSNPGDYTLAGDQVTFSAGLAAGDLVLARHFSL